MPPHDRLVAPKALAILMLALTGCTREAPSSPAPTLPLVERVDLLKPGGGVGWLRPTSAAVSSDGAVAVLDIQAPSLWLFHSGGGEPRQVGRPGRGPGEYASPAEVALNDAGEMAVLDLERRLVVFTVGGGHPWSRPLEGGTPTALFPTTDGFVVRLARPGVNGSLLYFGVGGRTDGDTLALIQSNADEAAPATCQFCPTTLSPDGTVILASGDTTYAVRELDRVGRTVRIWARRDVPSVPLSERARDSVQSRWDAAYAALRARGGPARPLPAIATFRRRILPHGLAFDGQSRLWVQRSVADTSPATFDLFTREGEFLGEVRLDRPGELLALRGSTLVVLHAPDLGEAEVAVYRMRDPNP